MTLHIVCPVCQQKVRVQDDLLTSHDERPFHRCKGSFELVETIRRYEAARRG